jgi:hypothetical protein
MRELILSRIEEIRKEERGFLLNALRWDKFSTGIDKRHISEINFSELDDNSLLFLFERMIKRYYS